MHHHNRFSKSTQPAPVGSTAVYASPCSLLVRTTFGEHTGPSAHTLGAIVSNVWTEFAGGIAPAAAATAHASGNSYAPGDSPSSTASDSDPSTATTAGSDSRGGWAPGSEGALEVLLLELEHGQVSRLVAFLRSSLSSSV
jgi:hypothetical protein